MFCKQLIQIDLCEYPELQKHRLALCRDACASRATTSADRPQPSRSVMDHVSPQGRSRIMQGIRNKDTRPELAVRRYLHAAGLRFRLHRRDLPGRPDLVFPGRRTIVFVHGCFWHQHENCVHAQIPRTRPEYWVPKLARTRQRDAENVSSLRVAGWHVETIWECEITEQNLQALARKIARRPIARG